MTTAIRIRFPAGRYHASPRDRYVNEAQVEWPPSPLRLLRTLIALWHRKADHSAYTDMDLDELIEALAAEPPVYRLPPATLTHTRHYMPVRSGKHEKRQEIFDAFLRLDPEDDLLAVWPGTVLSAAQRDLLSHLLERLSYLGRAESWADARLLDHWTALPDCGPQDSRDRWDPDPKAPMEPTDLPAPIAAPRYAEWRADQIEALGIEKPRLKRDKRLRATLPERLLDALRLDSADVRGSGWSRAPGTQDITYLRPIHVFARRSAVRRRGPGQDEGVITTVRFLVTRTRRQSDVASPSPLPRMEDAIRVGEAFRGAVMKTTAEPPPALSGHDLPAGAEHQHAFYLPEADSAGRIHAVMVHADLGIPADDLSALGENLDRLWVDGEREWRVMLDQFGSVRDFADHPYAGESRTWESVTPYLHPWYRKKNLTVEDQIRRELDLRGLPEPALERLGTVKVGGTDRRSVHFHRFRNRRRARQPDAQGSFWRVTFPEPVRGPLALGFGCHFGLGIFSAEVESYESGDGGLAERRSPAHGDT